MSPTQPTPQTPPYAITIATSDSGGGAGIQADLKTMTRLGVYGGSVIVAATAQNTRGVEATHVLPTDAIRAQFDALVDDFDIAAVKLGMLATAEAIETVADCLADYDGPVVLDPVMVATSGDRLLDEDAVDDYTDLFAQATLVTPNADEAEAITGHFPDTEETQHAAADQFFEWGADAVLLKGGHVDTDDSTVVDALVTPEETTTYVNSRIDSAATHGSGCTLSSAIAARLARGDDLPDAVERGIEFTHAALSEPADVGEGAGSVNHLVGGEWSNMGE
ncbi:bifunctional hydroxymethylpyrimidine kinase/phosphomethylpyrimidine kinase [Haloferax mediterranei ATCC 33500]|uniref:Phosphomethylpyrimidine kinase n=1 Tax=Haloferax mediterranei (strain ATCC 33500 / DSM 1411 / JCM 8866 / NBRC 14739 / NCIMB 2177 / R-4) TaxID=523841 RepID=I3R801_HALMT|nr:bifunctional hydroxymethylpyrimidine kinase/phosphomethylpyrimidine kinase [Haloferax mediterranei]AFK20361.1 phosphomethylpyrimidine kinase [Haloferax mediterranei ATCC 33500]AHZ23727.1 phosphomethylpyrimidine kinase [Haloferax mediterranei ATCC 33500]ELZ99216.1 phosphomethylpyrimidine kinase [Haloferax mediterranei ATCC 33500]MDX5986884.1 bifunctional hydroxymethylpyrimidine kinase/phosphomethylpyrimidine kinase [Haloferax mediterranei ATCC 33500]QCQ76207.1 bifunctional hydroxymethylpyrim